MSDPQPTLFPRSLQGVILVLCILVAGLWGYHAWSYAQVARRTLDLQPTYPADLNSCTLAELELLPGIGTTLAQRIVAYREAHQGFHDPAELRDIPGIGPVTFEQVKDLVRIGPVREVTSLTTADASEFGVKKLPLGTKLDPNTATIDLLERVPGLGKTLAARVVDAREVASFRSVDDLRRVRGIGVKTLETARPYFRIDGK